METVIAGVRIQAEFSAKGQLPASISDDVFIVMRVCIEGVEIPQQIRFSSRCEFFERPLTADWGGIAKIGLEGSNPDYGDSRFVVIKRTGKTFAECRNKLFEDFKAETNYLALKVSQREAALQEAGE